MVFVDEKKFRMGEVAERADSYAYTTAGERAPLGYAIYSIYFELFTSLEAEKVCA